MHTSNSHPCPSKKLPLVVIIGPTAAGKTDLSFDIAQQCNGEIINADVGQFYRPFSVGVAKPDLNNVPVPCHLFDIIDQPIDLNVVTFKELVAEKVSDITARGKLPILVGGSHFYVQSLFYTPHQASSSHSDECSRSTPHQESSLWERLNDIDPERASAIHPHDTYRLQRALDVWLQTGIKPSQLQPSFSYDRSIVVIAVNPDRDMLKERINYRSLVMLDQSGWIEEASLFMDTCWEAFMQKKNLIGYNTIFSYLRGMITRDALVTLVQQETWNYAKRQKKFIKRFLSMLKKEQELNSAPVHIISSEMIMHDRVALFNQLGLSPQQ